MKEHNDSEMAVPPSVFLDFEAIGRILMNHAMVIVQAALVIFVALSLLTFFFTQFLSHIAAMTMITCAAFTILAVVIGIVQRYLLPRNTVLAAQIFIIGCLLVSSIMAAAVSSVTTILLTGIVMGIISLPLNSRRFTILCCSLSVILYSMSLWFIGTVRDVILELPSPIGPLINVIIVGLSFASIVMFLWLLSHLLVQTFGQSQQLAARSVQLRLAEEANNRALSEQIKEQKRLIEIVESLEVPIIPLGKGIIVVPLVGVLDDQRMQAIQTGVLQAVSRQHSTQVILDITGVPTIDSQHANQLIQLSQAVQLLGTQTVLTGMQSEIASSLVRLGSDLSSIKSYASIQQVLEQKVSHEN